MPIFAEFSDFNDKLELIDVKNKFRYIGAIGYSCGALNFKGYDSLAEYELDMKPRTNGLQYLINPVRYLYYDIDKVAWTEDEFSHFVTSFIDSLNKEIMPTQQIAKHHFQFHVKYNREKRIKSIHIVSNTFVMSTKQQHELVRQLHMTYKDLDKRVYTSGRAFYNCFHGKVGGRVFEYHKDNLIDYKLIWIDDDTNGHLLTYENTPDYTLEIKTENPVQYILENKTTYLRTGHNWRLLALFVKKQKLLAKEQFCFSSLVAGYTYDENVTYWDKLDEREAINSEKLLMERICFARLSKSPYTDELFDLMNFHETATREQMKYHADMKPFIYGENEFDPKTGILTIGDKSTLYYADQKLLYQELELEPITHDDIPSYLNDDRIFVRALYGLGKTHHIIDPIVKQSQENGQSVLLITESNVLNYQFMTKFGVKSHTDKSYNSDYAVTSLESLMHFTRTEYDVLILDEYVSLMAHFMSDTMNKRTKKSMDNLLKIISNTTKIVVGDADLSNETYSNMLDIIQPKPERKILHLTSNKYDDYEYELVFKQTTFMTMLEKAIADGKKISLAVNTKMKCKIFYDQYKDKKNIILVTQDGIIINNRELTPLETKQFKRGALDDYFIKNKIDMFIYSPTITTGVSINGHYFDKQFAVVTTTRGTCCPRTILQMIHRPRELTDKTITLLVPLPKRTAVTIDKDSIRQQVGEVEFRYNRLGIGDYKVDSQLQQIECECTAENQYGETNFTEALYILLKQQNLKVTINLTADGDHSIAKCGEDLMLRNVIAIGKIEEMEIGIEEDAKHLAVMYLNNEDFTMDEQYRFEFYNTFMDTKYTIGEKKTYWYNGLYNPTMLDGYIDNRFIRSIGILAETPELVKIKRNFRIMNNSSAIVPFTGKQHNDIIFFEYMKQIKAFVDGCVDDDGHIPDDAKIPEAILDAVNFIKRRGKDKTPYTTKQSSAIFRFIAGKMRNHFGYWYEKHERRDRFYSKATHPRFIFGRPNPERLDVRMGLELQPNQEYIQHGQVGKTNVYGIAFKNKYGNVPARLRRIYDAQKLLSTQREYLILPSKKVKHICSKNTAPRIGAIQKHSITGMLMKETKFLLV